MKKKLRRRTKTGNITKPITSGGLFNQPRRREYDHIDPGQTLANGYQSLHEGRNGG